MAVKTNGGNALPWLLICILLVAVIIVIYRQQSGKNTEQATVSISGDNGNLLLGNPTSAVHSISTPNNYFIDHSYYAESYNSSKGTPNWVSWHIGAADLGTVKRSNDFRPDKDLPGLLYAASGESYKNSGFEKGHNCPSGDRTASQEANTTTFLMDNIIPQAPSNNEHVWNNMENYCRNQVMKGNEAFVIMGNYGTGGTGTKGYTTTIANGHINVPAHIWKVVIILPEGNNDLARITTGTQIIAIDTPNDNTVSNNWMNYVTTVSAIEKKCNCNLLSALPAGVQQQLENEKYSGRNHH